MKKYEVIKQDQQKLKDQLIFLKNERGINYQYWIKLLGCNKGTISGWIGGNRNLPKEVYQNLQNIINSYLNNKII